MLMNSVVEVLGRIHPSLAQLQGPPLAIFLLVVALTSVFLVGYAIKGTQVAIQPRSALRGVRALRKANRTPRPEELVPLFRREATQVSLGGIRRYVTRSHEGFGRRLGYHGTEGYGSSGDFLHS